MFAMKNSDTINFQLQFNTVDFQAVNLIIKFDTCIKNIDGKTNTADLNKSA